MTDVILIQQGADVSGDVRDLPEGDYFAVTVRILVKPAHPSARRAMSIVAEALDAAGLALVPGSAVDSRLIDRKRRRKRDNSRAFAELRSAPRGSLNDVSSEAAKVTT